MQTTNNNSKDLLNFDEPIIEGCGQSLLLKIKDSDDTIRFKQCLISPSGKIYEQQKLLKSALYGEVYKCCVLQQYLEYYERTSSNVAIKIISKEKLSQKKVKQEDPMKEISTMQLLGNENDNVINLIECFSTDNLICCVMKYCSGGDLIDKVLQNNTENNKMSENEIRHYFKNILNGVEYMQMHHICHRDLSLENIVIDDNNNCVIIDMGMCIKVPYNKETGEIDLISQQGACGKGNYIPPEILINENPFDASKVDIWQLGIMLFILLCGIPPMEIATPKDARYRIISNSPNGVSRLITGWKIPISSSAIDMLSFMIKTNPEDRPTIDAIRNHPWMNATN
jgi:serine/threonine protein kinase